MSLDLLYPVFLGPTPVKASGRASPSTCNRFPKGRWGKVALLKGYEKFPKLQFRPLGLEGKLSSGRKSCHRCQGPSLTAPAARDPPPSAQGCQRFSRGRAGVAPARSPGPPPSAALSCSARSGNSSERVSGERRGGKVAPGLHAAVLLLLHRLASSPRCCSAGRRRSESTSSAQGGSHGARGRREPRTTWC